MSQRRKDPDPQGIPGEVPRDGVPGAGGAERPAEPRHDAHGDPHDPAEDLAEPGRRPGPFEALFAEIVRRTTRTGLSGFFLTEEAVRRAFNDVVPEDWVDYASRQSEEVRRELIDRISGEFGAYLREIDPEQLFGKLLEQYEFTARIEISARPRDRAPLSVVKK